MADTKTLHRSDKGATDEYQPNSSGPAHPEKLPLYGGLAGLPTSVPEFVLADGLVLRESYTHIFAPFMLAFAKPRSAGQHHPGPWKSARGGLAYDIEVEIGLARGSQPTNLDRLNTIWWTTALLRLATRAPLRLPIISDTPFAKITMSSGEPHLWPLEISPSRLETALQPASEILLDHLEWVKTVFVTGAELLSHQAFNRAVQTFDSASCSGSLSNSTIMVWAALETLFRPGRLNIKKTLAMCIAAFMYPPGPDRDKLFQHVDRLYELRGSIVHDSQVPEHKYILSVFELGRQILIRVLDLSRIPTADDLLTKWKQRG